MPSQTAPQVESPFDLETEFAFENQQEYFMVDYSSGPFCESGLYAYYPKAIYGYIQLGVQTELQNMTSTFEKFTSCENYCKGELKQNPIRIFNRYVLML